MDKVPIKNWQGRILGWVETDSLNGNKILRDFYGKIIGKYNKQFDMTTDFYGRQIGKGDILLSMLPTDAK